MPGRLSQVLFWLFFGAFTVVVFVVLESQWTLLLFWGATVTGFLSLSLVLQPRFREARQQGSGGNWEQTWAGGPGGPLLYDGKKSPLYERVRRETGRSRLFCLTAYKAGERTIDDSGRETEFMLSEHPPHDKRTAGRVRVSPGKLPITDHSVKGLVVPRTFLFIPHQNVLPRLRECHRILHPDGRMGIGFLEHKDRAEGSLRDRIGMDSSGETVYYHRPKHIRHFAERAGFAVKESQSFPVKSNRVSTGVVEYRFLLSKRKGSHGRQRHFE